MHGAKRNTSKHEGCNTPFIQGGVCVRHGANVKACILEGCTNTVCNKNKIMQPWRMELQCKERRIL